jgi:hypothetical protein
VEETIDLGEANQKPTISASDMGVKSSTQDVGVKSSVQDGQSHGGSVARCCITGVARAVEGCRVSEREGLGVGFDPHPSDKADWAGLLGQLG